MPDNTALFDRQGRRITSQDVRQAMRINIVAGCLGMAWFSMTVAMPLTMFMEAIGASGFLIGAITTVRLVAMGVQVPAALYSENLGSRKRFWAPLVMTQRATWFLLALIPLFWSPARWWIPLMVIALVGAGEFLGNAGTASWLSWMTDLVPLKTSGRFWGVRQSIITTASLLGMALAGFLLDLYRNPKSGSTAMPGFSILFGIAAFLGVADICVHLWVKEPRPEPLEKRPVLARMLAPLKSRDFRHLTLALGAWNFGCALIGTFGIVYLKRDFNVTYSQLAAVSIAAALGTISTSFVFGYLIDRLGARPLCVISLLAAPVPASAWFFVNHSMLAIPLPLFGPLIVPQAIFVQCFASFVLGGIFASVAICQLRLAAVLSSPNGRTTAMAVHWSLVGLLASLAPLLGGDIMDWVAAHPVLWLAGAHLSFFDALVLLFTGTTWCVAVPFLLSIRKPTTEASLGIVASRMFLINPVLAVRNFYIVQTMSGNTSSHQRAQAVRSLGINRSAVAVPDLVEKLDDPAVEVREEAIEALGVIATTEAVDALLAALADPASDLTPRICRALRHAADPRSVEPLLRTLLVTDRETLSEAARALGAIGDRRAIPPLLDLIKSTRDNKVIAAASETLASLGELSAAYQIIPQMRITSNQALKRALAVAAGDLLGEKEVFYKLLISETDSAGSGAGELLSQLSRALRKRFPEARTQLSAVALLEMAYLEGKVTACAGMLLHLGLHLVQFVHHLPICLDPHEVMQDLLERDRRAAIGLWYLEILNEVWLIDGRDSRARADVLLGMHIVCGILQSAPHAPAVREGIRFGLSQPAV